MSSDTTRATRPLEILVLSSYLPGVGGGELQTALQVQTLMRRGHKVRVIDLGNSGNAPVSERIDGVPVDRLRATSVPVLAPVIRSLRLASLLNRLLPRTDVVQFNHVGPELLTTLPITRVRGVPIVVVVWGSARPGVGPFGPGARRALARWAARRVLHVVALGSETRRNLMDAGFDAGRLHVISNGVDLSRFGPHRRDARVPEGFPPVGPVAVSVGRLVPAKAYPLLIDAWHRLLGRFPDARLVIVGEGPERTSLERQVAHLGLTGRIYLPGLRRDIPDWLGSADLFVSCSSTEGMSNALLEAIASGLPVVATRVGGAEDVVNHGENGLLVQPGSVEALHTALSQVLESAELRREMGRLGRARAEEHLGIERIVAQYESLYRHAMAAGAHAP